MVSKVRERIYAESAARLLDVDWHLVEIPEPLDFQVQTEQEVFGLEVRQVFADGEATFGSPSKRAEAENQKRVRSVAAQYYSQGGPPLSVKFLGDLASIESRSLVERMRCEAPTLPFEQHTFAIGRVKVVLTAVPKEFGDYQHWLCVDDRVGWVREATNDDLQRAVDRKRANLPLYLEKFSIVDLLLVADRTMNSGRMRSTGTLSVQNPGFRAVYFLSHPESAERVG
ncbi:hypothetical protein Y695_02287 [Hydrogenophaga sp. T4]|nr:hypothetical protein Y695_02287 [Hydrogenophaga sp. T4]